MKTKRKEGREEGREGGKKIERNAERKEARKPTSDHGAFEEGCVHVSVVVGRPCLSYLLYLPPP
jgi:hypothetical protein